MIDIVNPLVFLFGLVVLIYKVVKLCNLRVALNTPMTKIIIAFLVSDILDVTCTSVFSFNSVWTQITGNPAWNDIDPWVAVFLRVLIFGSSWAALIVSSRVSKQYEIDQFRIDLDEMKKLIEQL